MPNLHFRIAWRALWKDRQSALLNLIGLSTGLTCTLLISMWVNDELQMDKFHEKGERLYMVKENRIKSGGIWTSPTTSGPMAEALVNDRPEIEYAITTRDAKDITLTVNENNIKAQGKHVGRDFFNLFTYPLIHGNKDQVLTDKNSIVLSDVLAKKLFGTTEHILGKTIEWQHDQHYAVSGIFKAPGAHSSNQFDFVLSIDILFETNQNIKSWGNTSAYTYLTLKPGVDADQFNARIADFVKVKTNGETTHRTPFIVRYSDIYLHDTYENGVVTGGRIDYVNLFSIVAIFILVIACINFINLSTAKAARRTKEVGIKKVVGATRGTLIIQYLGESMLMAFASLLLAILLVFLFLPAFNNITGKQLTFYFDTKLVLLMLAITLFTGLIAGSYPALYLSSFKPGLVLKGKINSAATELLARKGLVVFQFTLSVVLIVSVLVVYKQLHFVQSKNLGYNRDNIVCFSREGKLSGGKEQDAFLAEMRSLPGVVNASTLGHDLTGHWSGTSGVQWKGRDPQDQTEFENVSIYYGMIETLGISLKEGRTFSKDFGADSSAIIFNEAAVKYMGLTDPIGKMVTLWGEPRQIIGVVKDFHYESLHKEITPVFFRLSESASQFMARIKPGREKETIDGLQQLYAKFNPGFKFDYKFLDDKFQDLYAAENRVSILSRYFAGLAILISCLGLFGLAAFTAQTRQKEISIRKVVGATVRHIVVMLSKDFLQLVLIAVLIAFPLSWWAVNNWLSGFAYRTPIGYGIFVIAGVSIFLITIITISFQSIKAALSNPVKSLKNE